ncbi:MAG: hypothetical protein AAF663_08655 [Planctomycetota bacterium]
MAPPAEQHLAEFKKAVRHHRQRVKTSAQAAEFLVRAGIAVKTTTTDQHPQGVRLAKRFR